MAKRHLLIFIFGIVAMSVVLAFAAFLVAERVTGGNGLPTPMGVCFPGSNVCKASPAMLANLPQVSDAPTVATTSILFVGDLMFDREVAVRDGGKPGWAFQKIGNVKANAFGHVDLAVGNLEGPITPTHVSSTKSIDFAFPPAVAPALKQEGFDALSQANNHSLDQGRAGADDSRLFLSAAGLTVFGDQTHDDATSSLAYVTDGRRKIALLGFHNVDRPLDMSLVAADVALAKQTSDVVIVFMHWGVEYTEKPTSAEVELGHWFIDHGVDAVIGSHPHWMQSVETYEGKPIVYSLGDFVFDQDFSTETERGLAVRFDVGPTTRSISFYPIGIFKSQPAVLVGEDRTGRLQRLASLSDPSLSAAILSGTVYLPKP